MKWLICILTLLLTLLATYYLCYIIYTLIQVVILLVETKFAPYFYQQLDIMSIFIHVMLWIAITAIVQILYVYLIYNNKNFTTATQGAWLSWILIAFPISNFIYWYKYIWKINVPLP